MVDIMDEEMAARQMRSVRHNWLRFHELADDDPMLNDFPDFILPPFTPGDRRKWEERYGNHDNPEKGGEEASEMMD